MPFVARCASCGYILMASCRQALNDDMTDHDRESHQEFDSEDFEFCGWTVAVISHTEYSMLLRSAKTSAFWRAIRRSPRTHFFLDCVAGRIAFLQT